MKTAREKIDIAAEKLVARGEDMKHVTATLLHAGLDMHTDNEKEKPTAIIVRRGDNQGVEIEWPMPGYKIALVPIMPAKPIQHRAEELLDFANCYGDYDENTPNGTPSKTDGGGGMNDYRRGAIVLLKKLLGQLPDDYGLTFPDHVPLIRETATLLDGYAQHHLAKSPPDIDKANRNVRQAEKLFGAIGVEYVAPTVPEQTPQEAAREAQERDKLPGTAERPYKGSTAPLDRQEMLDWIDMKLDGCAKHGMRETADVLQAMRGEIAQHLEAAPIDYATALRTLYHDVHARNAKAGWWTDLKTNLSKKRSVGELLMLFVTEIAEAYDAYERDNAPDDKLPHHSGFGVELGDLQIRLADLAGALAAGSIVAFSDTRNPGDRMFREVCMIARHYEAIRKTPEAVGDDEAGEPLPPADVGIMVVEKLAFNAERADHKPENRMKEGGKQT